MTTIITDKEIAKLAYQFETSSNLIDFLKAFLAESDELYDSSEDLKNDRNIDDAVGVQLDGIGQIVGIARPQGMSDDDYRLTLKAKIMINQTDMSVNSILDLFQFVFGADRVEYILPANLDPNFVIGGTITDDEEFIFSYFPSTLGVGITYTSIPSFDDAFAWDEDTTGKGWGDETDPLVGGNWAKIIGV